MKKKKKPDALFDTEMRRQLKPITPRTPMAIAFSLPLEYRAETRLSRKGCAPCHAAAPNGRKEAITPVMWNVVRKIRKPTS
jgi:hypothetical protein